jgi:hypothetical protein
MMGVGKGLYKICGCQRICENHFHKSTRLACLYADGYKTLYFLLISPSALK